MINIQMIGIDHSRASVEERELFSFTKTKQKELMEAVVRQQSVDGSGVLLSTCNRMELYVSLDAKAEPGSLPDYLPLVNRFPEKKKKGYGNFLRCELKKTRCGIFFC